LYSPLTLITLCSLRLVDRTLELLSGIFYLSHHLRTIPPPALKGLDRFGLFESWSIDSTVIAVRSTSRNEQRVMSVKGEYNAESRARTRTKNCRSTKPRGETGPGGGDHAIYVNPTRLAQCRVPLAPGLGTTVLCPCSCSRLRIVLSLDVNSMISTPWPCFTPRLRTLLTKSACIPYGP
jgi:hypothetical protein